MRSGGGLSHSPVGRKAKASAAMAALVDDDGAYVGELIHQFKMQLG